MPNKDIFCNIPWYQGQVFWDGNYGHCCAIDPDPSHGYNVKTHTIKDWVKSDSMVNFKKQILGNEKNARCTLCYREEEQGHTSKRLNENLKNAIWPGKQFDASFRESPARQKFINLEPSLYREWHLDIGNECNLACKMCHPGASSKIETAYKKWQLPVEDMSKKLWVNHPSADKFIKEIIDTPDLKRVHIMGGEPMIQPNFRSLLKTLSTERPDISFSFVSNATKFDNEIFEDLNKFSSVDIELSLEAVDPVNDYIRQGSKIADVVNVIEKWASRRTETFNVILRPTVSILSVARYRSLLEFAFKHKIIVMSIVIHSPEYLRISLLPQQYRQPIIDNLQDWSDQIVINNNEQVGNRDPSRYKAQLKRECDGLIDVLKQDPIPGKEQELITWLQRWDNYYKLNVVDYLPEFTDFFIENGYTIPN